MAMDKKILFLFLIVSGFFVNTYAQEDKIVQNVRGGVTEEESGRELKGITVTLEAGNYQQSQTTNEAGKFRFDEVPPGRYELRVTSNEYQAYYIPNLLVHAGKQQVLSISLDFKLYGEGPVTITQILDRQPSVRSLTVEESKRFAGVYFDPARVAASMPGVIQANDQANSMVERGKTPNGI